MAKILSIKSLRNAVYSLRARDINPFPGWQYQTWVGKNIVIATEKEKEIATAFETEVKDMSGVFIIEATHGNSIGEEEAIIYGVDVEGKLVRHVVEFMESF